MTIDNKTVKNIAWLSRLEVPEEKLDSLSTELNTILGWVEQLKEVNTDDVQPLTSVIDAIQPLRDDQANMSNLQEDILCNAPEKKYGFYVVPKVIE